jgi:hypothetical protein
MKRRLIKLELAAQHRATKDRPIYLDFSKYDKDGLLCLELGTGRKVLPIEKKPLSP